MTALPKLARVGDSIQCDVRHPFQQTIRMRLDTPAAAAHANDLLMDPKSGWRLAGNAGVGAVGESKCDGCGGTIAQHDKLLHCRCDQTRYCNEWPNCDPPCHIGARRVTGEQVSPALARQRRLVATLPQTAEQVARLTPCAALGKGAGPVHCGHCGKTVTPGGECAYGVLGTQGDKA